MPEQLFPTNKPRPRNEIWDALAEIFGDATTRTNQTRRGKIVASLKEAGATRDEIYRRSRMWHLHFPGATLTATALEKWWDQLGMPPVRATDAQLRELERARDRAALEEMTRDW